MHPLVKSARTWSWAINDTPAVIVENRVKFIYQHQTRVVADAKEYLTNRVQLSLGGDWRVKLHELVLELLALCLDAFLSNEPFHFERFEEWQERTREGRRDLRWLVGWLVGWT